MMKKEYIQPQLEVIELKAKQLLTASQFLYEDSVDDFDILLAPETSFE